MEDMCDVSSDYNATVSSDYNATPFEAVSSDVNATVSSDYNATPSIRLKDHFAPGETFSRFSPDTQVNLVSVLNPRPLKVLKSISKEYALHYWRFNVPVKGLTFAEQIVDLLLDPSYVCDISDADFATLFSTRANIENAPCRPDLAFSSLDGLRIKRACAEISRVMGYSVGTPELKKYEELVEILKPLPFAEQETIRQRMDVKYGDITLLASAVTLGNINYFMNKVKITNSLPLIHQIFRAPSVAMKLNALWKLLELTGVLWQSLPWSAMQSLVQAFYSLFEWAMEKLGLAKTLMGEGFEWVKAKVLRDPKDEVVPQVNEILKNHKFPVVHGNDCLYEAVAPQIGVSSQALKEAFIAYLEDLSQDDYLFFVETNSTPDTYIEPNPEEVLAIASGSGMKDLHTVVYLSHFVNRNIIVVQDDSVAYDNVTLRETEPLYIAIRPTDRHFFAIPKKDVETIPYFGGGSYRHTMKRCNLCQGPDANACPICNKPVCVACYLQCCPGNKVATEVKQEDVQSLPRRIVGSDETSSLGSLADITDKIKTKIVESTLKVSDASIIDSFYSTLETNSTTNGLKAFLTSLFTDVYQWLQENPILVGLVSLASVIATFLGITIPTLANPLDKRSFISKFSDAARTVSNAQRAGTQIVDSFKSFGEALATAFGISTDSMIMEFKDRLAEINTRATSLLDLAQADPGKFVNSSEEMAVFEQNLKDVTKIYSDLTKVGGKANLSVCQPIWHQLNKSAQMLHNFWTKFRNCSSERQEPVVLWLWGDTNLGKSKLLNHILREINRVKGTSYKTFTISKGPAYWNSFIGQKFIKIDDFGSYLGPEGALDALSLFNLKTCAAYNPNMAGMEVKEIMATPYYVVVASNHPTVALNSGITDIPAFERRRDFFVRVSWQGHEGVCNKSATCDHLRDLIKKKKENGGKETYDHLTLTNLEPCTSEVGITNDCGYNARKVAKLKPRKVTVDELVHMMIEKEEEARYNFETSFRQTMEQQSLGDIVERWAEYPTISLEGPPGTGKSHILNTLCKKHPDTVQRIVTSEDYRRFMETKAPLAGKKFLIFDDLSAHVLEEDFKVLLNLIVARSNGVCEVTSTWILGVNRLLLDTHIHKYFAPDGNELACQEAEDMFYRRLTTITTGYKKKPGFNLRNKYYTRKDVASNPATIDEFVRYRLPSGEDTVQSQVVSFLEKFAPRVEEVQVMNDLPTCPLKTPDVSLEVAMTQAEFLKLISKASVTDLLKLVNSKGVTYKTNGPTLSEMAAKIMRSMRTAVSHQGIEFDTLREFWIECNNKRFLAHFEGITCFIILSDAAFSIERGRQAYPMIHSIDDARFALEQAKQALRETSVAITTSDFLSIAKAEMSPWFCFIGDLIATVAKISVSALSVSHSLMEQELTRHAYVVFDEVRKGAMTFVDTEINAITDAFGRRLYVNDQKRDKTAYALPTPEDDPLARLRTDIDLPETGTPSRNRSDRNSRNWRKETGTPTKKRTPPKKYPRKEVIRYDEDGERISTRAIENRYPTNEVFDDEKPILETFDTEEQVADIPEIIDIHGVRNEYCETANRRSGKKPRVTAVVETSYLEKQSSLPVTQASSDPAVVPIIHKVAPNMLTINNRQGDRVCFALAIRKDLATTVLHLTEQYNLADLTCVDMYGRKYTMKEEYRFETTDRLDFRLHGKPPADFADISKHLASVTYKDMNSRNGVLVNLSQSIGTKVPVLVIRSYKINCLTDASDEHSGKQLRLIRFEGHRMGFTSMDVLTRKGDCGSILFVLDPHSNTGRIVGMHSRASTSVAYARPINAEDYERQHKETLPPTLEGRYNYIEPFTHPELPQVIGRTKLKVHVPTKTKLYRNIAPVGPKEYEPSILSEKDTRNPGHKMILNEALKWTEAPPELSAEDQNLLLQATREIARHTVTVLKNNNSVVKVLTRREAINKYRHTDHSEPIPVNTSAGYPWSILSPEPGKRAFISVDPNNGSRVFKKGPLMDQVFEAMNNVKQAALGNAVLEEPVFMIHLKDEPLKLKKIYGDETTKVPRTRTIAACPLHITILHRQYVHAGIACLMDCHSQLPYAVGMDPVSPDWDIMFKKGSAIGSKVVALDYKGWDFTLHPFLISRCLPLFWNTIYEALDPDWTPDDNTIRNFLYQLFSEGIICADGLLMRILRGILSGLSSTAPDNSIANHIKKFFVWLKTMLKVRPQLMGYDHFLRETYNKYYGDDFFIVLSNYIAPLYNAFTIRDVEEPTFGVKLTSADKVSEIQQHQPWNEISFLSRDFKVYGSRCYGVLEWARVCKPTWWCHDSRSHNIWESFDEVAIDLTHIESTYENILTEAVMHGFTKFEQIRVPAQEALWKAGSDKTLPSFNTLYAEINGSLPPLEMRYDTELSTFSAPFIPKVPSHARKFNNRTSWSYGQGYDYPGARHPTVELPPPYKDLLQAVNKRYGRRWNSILVNSYPIGGEIPWHYDNEPELDIDEGVGCLTVTGGGRLHLMANGDSDHMIDLRPNDFYIMGRDCLRKFRHKRDQHHVPTISITFRKLDEKRQ